jgi:hypothetical protein
MDCEYTVPVLGEDQYFKIAWQLLHGGLYVVARLCVVPGVHEYTCGVDMNEPSTCIIPLLDGLESIVMETADW